MGALVHTPGPSQLGVVVLILPTITMILVDHVMHPEHAECSDSISRGCRAKEVDASAGV